MMPAGDVRTNGEFSLSLLREGSSSLTATDPAVLPQRSSSGVFIVGLLGTMAMTCTIKRNRRLAMRSKAAETIDDDFLIQAGLRNLLGGEENEMARKLEKTCAMAGDTERCMNDIEVKNKLVMTELSRARHEGEELKVANENLKREIADLEEGNTRLKDVATSYMQLQAEKENSYEQSVAEREQLYATINSLEADLKIAADSLEAGEHTDEELEHLRKVGEQLHASLDALKEQKPSPAMRSEAEMSKMLHESIKLNSAQVKSLLEVESLQSQMRTLETGLDASSELRNKVERLEAIAGPIQAQIATEKKEKETLEEEKKELEARSAQELELLQERLSALAAEKQEMEDGEQNEKEQLKASIQELHVEKVASSEQALIDKGALRSENEALQDDNEQLLTDQVTLRAELEQLKTTVEKLRGVNEDVEIIAAQETDRLALGTQALQDEKEVLVAERDQLRFSLQELQAETEDVKAKIIKFQAGLSEVETLDEQELQAAYDALTTESQQEQDSAAEEIDQLTAHMKALQAEKEQVGANFAQYKDQATEDMNQLEQTLSAENERLQQEYNNLSEGAEHLNDSIQILESEQEQLSANALEEQRVLTTQVQDLEQETSQLQADTSQQIDQLKTTIKTSLTEKEEAEQKFMQEKQQLQAALETLQSGQQATHDNEQLSLTIQALENEKCEIEQKLQKLQVDYDALIEATAENEEMVAKIKELETEKEQLEAELTQHRDQLDLDVQAVHRLWKTKSVK